MAARDKKPDNPPFYSGRAQCREKFNSPIIKAGNVQDLFGFWRSSKGGCIVPESKRSLGGVAVESSADRESGFVAEIAARAEIEVVK